MKFSFLFLSALLLVAADDPFLGRWTLNPQLSKYPEGAMPARMVIEMERDGDGVRYHSETTHASGKVSQSEYTAADDGKQVFVKGSAGMMAPVAQKRLGPNVVEASYFKNLKVVATSRREVSSDGKRMTVTTTAEDKAGKAVTTISVYEHSASPPAALAK